MSRASGAGAYAHSFGTGVRSCFRSSSVIRIDLVERGELGGFQEFAHRADPRPELAAKAFDRVKVRPRSEADEDVRALAVAKELRIARAEASPSGTSLRQPAT